MVLLMKAEHRSVEVDEARLGGAGVRPAAEREEEGEERAEGLRFAIPANLRAVPTEEREGADAAAVHLLQEAEAIYR